MQFMNAGLLNKRRYSHYTDSLLAMNSNKHTKSLELAFVVLSQ